MAAALVLLVAALALGLYLLASGPGGSGPSTTTAPDAGDSSDAGGWRVRDASAAGDGLLDVGVSDDLLVTSGSGGLIAYPLDGGAPVAISSSPYPEWDLEGSLVVWAEAELTEDGAAERGSVWMRDVPDGRPELIASAEGIIRRPRAAVGMVAWAEPRPAPDAGPPASPDSPPEWQYLSISVARWTWGGLEAEVRVVANDVTEQLAGTSPWVFDLDRLFDPDRLYVGWQQDVATDEWAAGIWVVDANAGRVVFSAPETAMPTMTSGLVAFESDAGVELHRIGALRSTLIDPLGERPALSHRFLAYLRPRGPGAGASGDRQVVVRELESGREWVLGPSPADLWYRPPPSVSDRFAAYLGVDGQVELFEWVGE